MTLPPAERPSGVAEHRSRRTIARLLRRLRRGFALAAPRLFLRCVAPTTRELGLAGEELVARWLARRGWRLRGRRVRTPAGEVDLWAELDGASWVIEVKTGRLRRRGAASGSGAAGLAPFDLRWRPGLRVGARQIRRLFRAARHLGGGRRGEPRPGVLLVEVLVAEGGRAVAVVPSSPLREGEPPRLGEVVTGRGPLPSRHLTP